MLEKKKEVNFFLLSAIKTQFHNCEHVGGSPERGAHICSIIASFGLGVSEQHSGVYNSLHKDDTGSGFLKGC